MSASAVQTLVKSRILVAAALMSCGFAVIGARLIDVMVFEATGPEVHHAAAASRSSGVMPRFTAT